MLQRHFHNAAPVKALTAACVFIALCLLAPKAPAAEKCDSDYVCKTGDPESCPDAPVYVTATTAGERRLACSAANEALQLLGRCGIFPRRPLQLHIVSEVRHPLKGVVIGLFDSKQEIVLVTREANIPSLVKGTPYAELPLRDVYKGLIVHEVVHGVMHQNYKQRPTSHAAYEYPAYALQLASLPSSVRERFLRALPNKPGPGDSLFNDIVLFFDPYFFAAQAYEHFNVSPDGCGQLHALLTGEVMFIPTLPP